MKPETFEAGIADFVQKLQQAIRVEAVISFGTHSWGAAYDESDVDLAVISPDFESIRLPKRQEMIAALTVHRYPGLLPLGYPSSEYHNPGLDSFLQEIIRTGKVVYQGR